MKTPNKLSLLLVLFSTLSAATILHAEAKPKVKEIIDFRQQTVERDGAQMREIRKYGFAYGDWDKKLVYLEGRGILVQAPGGKGNFGGDKSMKFKPGQLLALEVLIGNQNKAAGFSVTLIDADGTEQSWNLPLGGKPTGVGLVYTINLAKCDREAKPGSTPGLDRMRIRKWQIQGDWQSNFTELLVSQMLMIEQPTN